jgi:hypothetical protein
VQVKRRGGWAHKIQLPLNSNAGDVAYAIDVVEQWLIQEKRTMQAVMTLQQCLHSKTLAAKALMIQAMPHQLLDLRVLHVEPLTR